MDGKITVVVGGQFGSEAKGTVVGALAAGHDVCVRTGAINAGHTVYYKGKAYKMQLLPVGWVNPEARLVLGAGTYVHEETLNREIEMINEAMPGSNVAERLYIDPLAGMHTQAHHEAEHGMHERMGSTAEGCGAALIDKVSRRSGYKNYGASWKDTKYAIPPVDTVGFLREQYRKGSKILVEGTQGTGLDLHYGTYPYCTSRQTIASAWLAEAGLPPTYNIEVIMVVRTFPIRVAGNSGPFPYELSWSMLAGRVNSRRKNEGMPPAVEDWALAEFDAACVKVAAELKMPNSWPHMWDDETRAQYAQELSRFHGEVLKTLPEATVAELKKFFETTTVTKKMRRIASMDLNQLRRAVHLNGPTKIALMFLNYEFPELEDAKTWSDIDDRPGSDDYRAYISELEDELGVKVGYVNVSPLGIIEVPEGAVG